MTVDTICPLEVKFACQDTCDFFDKAMSIKTRTRVKKQYYWFICERNLLAALLFYFEGDNIPVDRFKAQRVLSGGVEKVRSLLGSLPQKHPGSRYYGFIAEKTDSAINSIIISLSARVKETPQNSELQPLGKELVLTF